MKKQIIIMVYFKDRDFISSLVHYGVRINSKFIGFSRKFNQADEAARQEKIAKTLKSI